MNEFFNKVKDFVAGHKKAVIITSVAVLLAVVVLIAVLLLVGGEKPELSGDPTNAPTQTAPVPEKVEYKVTVKNQLGNTMTDVGISIFADDTLAEMVWFGKTDEEGVMSFKAKANDGYVAVLESVSGGYAGGDCFKFYHSDCFCHEGAFLRC